MGGKQLNRPSPLISKIVLKVNIAIKFTSFLVREQRNRRKG